MDLKQLETFVRVAELGSFTRAAQSLDMAQPALSRQVRALELELREALFTRTGRGVVPTDAGLYTVTLVRDSADQPWLAERIRPAGR